jgi:hypothetical protein
MSACIHPAFKLVLCTSVGKLLACSPRMQEIVGSIPVDPNKRLTLVFAATQLSSHWGVNLRFHFLCGVGFFCCFFYRKFVNLIYVFERNLCMYIFMTILTTKKLKCSVFLWNTKSIVGSIPVDPNKRLTLVFAATQLSSLDFCVVFCRSLFLSFSFNVIVLCVSGNHVDIFKLFVFHRKTEHFNSYLYIKLIPNINVWVHVAWSF